MAVPVRVAYNQWTHFESFPHFMAGVERVDQVDPAMTHWVTKVGGVTREFNAETVEQRPDECVVWRALGTPDHTGRVEFESLAPDRTRVTLRMEFGPRGVVEHVGDALGLVQRQVRGDLDRFKEFIEGRERETGSWRGEIRGGHVQPGSPPPPKVPHWPTG